MTTAGAPNGDRCHRILIVCTANVCRSPVVERLLQRELDQRGIDVDVTPAGTHGGRNVVHTDTVRAADLVEVDLRDHRSRGLTPEIIQTDGRDLVIALTRQHLRDIVGVEPAAWPRAFTLKELVRRAYDVPMGVDDLRTWVKSASDGRQAADLTAPSTDDDLIDPYGGPYEVDELVGRLARLLPSGR